MQADVVDKEPLNEASVGSKASSTGMIALVAIGGFVVLVVGSAFIMKRVQSARDSEQVNEGAIDNEVSKQFATRQLYATEGRSSHCESNVSARSSYAPFSWFRKSTVSASSVDIDRDSDVFFKA